MKVCDAGVGGGEGVVGGQAGLDVGAGEVDRAGVAGRDVAEAVHRRDRDVERCPRGRRRPAPTTPRRLAAGVTVTVALAAVIGGGGDRDRLAAGGDQASSRW